MAIDNETIQKIVEQTKARIITLIESNMTSANTDLLENIIFDIRNLI